MVCVQELETPAEQHLFRQLQEARQLLQEQEQLTAAALRLRPSVAPESHAMDSGAVHIQGDIMGDHMPWIQVRYIFKGI